MTDRTRVGMLVLLVALGGCAADGGQRGSGVSSLEGNVAAVRDGGGIAGLRVAIEGDDVGTATDAEGRFALRGAFEGYTTLRFTRPDVGGAARVTVNAPAAGTVVLHDVELDPAAGTARAAATEVTFEGRVVEAGCAEGRMVLASVRRAADDLDTYVVALGTSSLRGRDGAPLACGDVRDGDRFAVHGFFADDGAIGDADLRRR